MLRFDLNLQSDTGTVDPTFAPISVPGDPATAGVNIAHDGGVLVVLVTSGSTVYAYNAQTGAPAGSFTTAVPVNAVATAGNITVLGSTQINELHMINLTASLQTGTAQGLDSTSPFVPQRGHQPPRAASPGSPGRTTFTPAIAAHFSTLQPDRVQLGVEAIGTLLVNAGTQRHPGVRRVLGDLPDRPGHQRHLHQRPRPLRSRLARSARPSAPWTRTWRWTPASRAATTSSSSTPRARSRRSGTIKLAYPDLLAGLSQSFRTDLGGAALIDIQGDVQSVRGSTANGMFFNDTGNLATIKIQRRSKNSTIVGQPISHLGRHEPERTRQSYSSSREAGDRNGAMQVVQNIQPIGPTTPQGNS